MIVKAARVDSMMLVDQHTISDEQRCAIHGDTRCRSALTVLTYLFLLAHHALLTQKATSYEDIDWIDVEVARTGVVAAAASSHCAHLRQLRLLSSVESK